MVVRYLPGTSLQKIVNLEATLEEKLEKSLDADFAAEVRRSRAAVLSLMAKKPSLLEHKPTELSIEVAGNAGDASLMASQIDSLFSKVDAAQKAAVDESMLNKNRNNRKLLFFSLH